MNYKTKTGKVAAICETCYAFLPDDVARCRGVFDEDDGEIYWREGCEQCARRLAPANGTHVVNMEPPPIIAFWCEFLIEA